MQNKNEKLVHVPQSSFYLFVGIVIATYFKIWLADVYVLRAVFAPHDDHLFVTLASHILNGAWLGPYDQYTQFTSMKGAFYPIWLSLSNILGIPLLTGQHLLYSFASILFIISLSPFVKNKWWLFIIYVFLIFNPFALVVDRVFRLGIYPALTIFVVASAFGLYTRTFSKGGRPLYWAIGLGLSLAAFWHTREEAIWIIPSLLVVLFFTLLKVWANHDERPGKIAILYCIPLVILGLSSLFLASMNWYKYDVFTPLEIHSSEFESAYSGLLKIKTDKTLRFYPVLKEARMKAYAVSPAFAELKPFLEGRSGKQWQGDRPDIPAAFFIWAFRDAVYHAGYYNNKKSDNPKNIKQTFEFYQRMGDELEAACRSGKLECVNLISPFMPQWNEKFTDLLIPTYYEIMKTLVSFDGFNYKREDLYSTGTYRTFQLFEAVTDERLQPDRGSLVQLRPDFYKKTSAVKKKFIRNIWKNFYANIIPWLFIVFLVLIPLRGLYELFTGKYHAVTALGLSALAAVLSNAAILTLVRITSYQAIDRAMSPGYPVLIIFIVCGFILLSEMAGGKFNRKKTIE